jgi:DMSO/TMAO reductase YedYZ molybdopterin-dependent catalytic subunit
MPRPTPLAAATTALALGLPLLALMYLGGQAAQLPFAPFDLFSLVIHLIPGSLVNMGLEALVGALQTWRVGDTDALAKTLQAALAVALWLGLAATLGGLYGALAQRLSPHWRVRGAEAGLSLWWLQLPAGLLAGWSLSGHAWILALSAGWGLALAMVVHHWMALSQGPVNPARRSFLAQLGIGLAALTTLGLGLGRWLKRADASAAATLAPISSDNFSPVAGARAELTPIPDFYRVDIKLDPPRLDPETWRLEVGGAVAQPLTLSYADLTALPAEDFYATLECISNGVGGDLISTTLFRGVALRDVLALAQPGPETVDIKFICADGYSESLSLTSALDPGNRLCFAMGGAPLTPEHGAPVRLFAINRFGMKNPKWITKIEAVTDDYEGFWQQRRWSDIAWVQTTAVIDAARVAGPGGALEAGGIAYAGARGLSKVELRVDDGDWLEAELKPALSPLAWALWRITLTAPSGPHRLTVRATDGEGALQSARVTEAFPNGATGYHKFSVRVE